MPSSIHTRPWDAASEVVCMLTDLRLDATLKDLDWNLSTMKDLAPIQEAPTPELKQVQTQVFDTFTNYLQVLKDSYKPLGATKDLQEQPSKACVILEEVLTCVDQKTRWWDMDKIKNHIVERSVDYDDYYRMLRFTKQFIKDTDPTEVEDDEQQTLKLQSDIMKAFLTYTEHCKTVYLNKLNEDQSSNSSDEDEVIKKPKVTKQEEDIKEPYIPEPFPEHLIAIQLND
ncbi:hypothetical protein AWC38_SpisGene11816 [Stylophora pistillata]|uniref:Uncharacterized protein n=1 Tax=Stylophora pistillata TaxID=50429 RepID=A0A2B4S4V0_STYPI|nr:hypothetical protein AWC38_SpisGene11816 [Stylophora pistillata]